MAFGGDGVDAHLAVHLLGVFLHDDGVRTQRHGRAREDACRRARLQWLAHMTCGNTLADRQQRARLRHVGAAHGVAVHRRVVERRHLQCRDGIAPQHAAVGIPGVHGLGRVKPHGLCEHGREGIVERHEVLR
ncbi:hypothetical protein SDC9_177905 [bioreactor metagenome]|uniref:Uncharacterized protein n=1 Tax=bioreactor metagenome TaxID=1076179 RepID=A0A645H268_9ZZZZ